MAIEDNFNVTFVGRLALREKQIQQNYRPIIAVHKWFARRPGTLFRSLILSEFGAEPIENSFFQEHSFRGVRVVDPFMGGGTPLIEANRVGCDVIGYDINPVAFWVVQQELLSLDLEAYRRTADGVLQALEGRIGELYRTTCHRCGSDEARVKYFLWVKSKPCRNCGIGVDLFPGYLVAENQRHPRNVVVCPSCGDVNEIVDRKHPGDCRSCGDPLKLSGPAARSRCRCPNCGETNVYPDTDGGPPEHRMFAIEYYCSRCKPSHRGRFFKRPDDADLAGYQTAVSKWAGIAPRFVPEQEIPPGDETNRLHRWGYKRYREMFNCRQLLGLELLGREIEGEPNANVRNALATNLSDLLRYQNMLCRFDTRSLKSLDIFSIHGFPVGLVQCESNLLGIRNDNGVNVGSGGLGNIIEKYVKAKAYCDHPFEVFHRGRRKVRVFPKGEWIGEHRNWASSETRRVELHCASSTVADLPPSSVDAVFTDPPYYGNVQYAELMDFCYVWLRRLVGDNHPAFRQESTRTDAELTGNDTMERDLSRFTEGLSVVFQRVASALRPGGPLAFTYHHNKLEAYHPVAVAILDSSLECTAAFPCPAEMGASIHINGTGSSVVDTVFVCRSVAPASVRELPATPDAFESVVSRDLAQIRAAGLEPTTGDIRCVVYGHLVRICVCQLREFWNPILPVSERLQAVAANLDKCRSHFIADKLVVSATHSPARQGWIDYEEPVPNGANVDEVRF